MSLASCHDNKSDHLLHDDVKALQAEVMKFLLAPMPAGRGLSVKDALAYLAKKFNETSEEIYICNWVPSVVGANEHHLNSFDEAIKAMGDGEISTQLSITTSYAYLRLTISFPFFPSPSSEEVTNEFERVGQLVVSKAFEDPESPDYAEFYKFKKNRDLEEACLEDSRKQAELARICADTTRAVSRVWDQWEGGTLDYYERPHGSVTGMGTLFRRVFEETAPRDCRNNLDWELVVLLVSMV